MRGRLMFIQAFAFLASCVASLDFRPSRQLKDTGGRYKKNMIEKLQTQCSDTGIPMRLEESNKRKNRSQICRVFFITAEEWKKMKEERGLQHHIIKDLHNTLAHGTVPLNVLGTFCGRFLNTTQILCVKSNLRTLSLPAGYVASDSVVKKRVMQSFCKPYSVFKKLYLIKSH